MHSEYTICVRLAVMFFTLLSLAVSALSSANARFAFVLRDRARSDYINTTDVILDTNFQSLQSTILIIEVLTALGTAVFAIGGAVIAIHPWLLREKDAVLIAFGTIQLLVASAMVVTGGILADHVHGFQTSFAKFGAHDSTPYYSIIYYGNVVKVAYGSALIFLAITVAVGALVFNHYETKQYLTEHAIGQAAVTLQVAAGD